MDLIVSLLTLLVTALGITDDSSISSLQTKLETMDARERDELYATYTTKSEGDVAPSEAPAISVTIIDKE